MSLTAPVVRAFGSLLAAGALATFSCVPQPALADTPQSAQQREHARVMAEIEAAEVALGTDAWRAERFQLTPRRHEIAHIALADRTLNALIIYPQLATKAPVLLMIPEDQGLNNWAKDMADELSSLGFIVVVPDMVSGLGPNGGGRDSFPDRKSVLEAHSGLPAHEGAMTADLNRWADYAQKLPEANGKMATIGFAWGGGRAFWFATQRHDLSAVYVFYDAAPPAEKLKDLTAPVFGFYAAIDPRVTRSLPLTQAAMDAAHKPYEAVVYPGSDHMFMRLGEEPRNPNPADITARAAALVRLESLLKRLAE